MPYGLLLRRPRPVYLLLRRPRPVGAGCGASLGRSGAERADCTAVLGLAARRGTRCAPCRRSAQTAATRMFTNALRAGRKPCAPRRPRNRPRRAPPAATLCRRCAWCWGPRAGGATGPGFLSSTAKHVRRRGGWLHRDAGSIRACCRVTRTRHGGHANPMVCCNTICARLQAARCGRPAR